MFYWNYNLDSFIKENIQLTITSDKDEELKIHYYCNIGSGYLDIPDKIKVSFGEHNVFYCSGEKGSYTIIAESEDGTKQSMTLNILGE